MMSDSEPPETKADPASAEEMREKDPKDSLSTFSSEGSKDEGTYLLLPDPADLPAPARTSPAPTPSAPGWPSETASGVRSARYRSGHSVPVAIADDRATREAIWKLETYVETVTTLQAVCTRLDARLVQAEETLARTEGFVADRTLHELSTRIAARLAETEDAVRHIERVVTSGPRDELSALRTLCDKIEKRLAQVEETLGRSGEGLVTERAFHELSTHLSARVDSAFAQSDHALRRIEAALESKSAPSIDRSAVAPEAVVAEVPLRPSPPPALSSPSLVRGLPAVERLVGLGAVTVVLVGVLIFVAPARVPIRIAAPPPPRAEQPAAAPTVEQEPQEPSPPVEPAPPARLSTSTPAPEASAPAPRRRTAVRTTAGATAPVAPVRFVGDLSITSTPPGASVSINGRAVGVTPVVLREQRAGSVAVQIASDGFERWSASVQIPAGQVTRVAATLRASRPQ